MAWLQTASGIAFDLIHPSADNVEFNVDVAEALARIPRFTGHVADGPYSAAQHCVMGAEAIERDTGRLDWAAAFLLHDAHEAYLGDITTPVADAMGEYAAQLASDHTQSDESAFGGELLIRRALQLMKHRLDKAIHEAAGLAFPLDDDTREVVKLYDLRMLATEREDLLGPSPRAWHPAIEAAKRVDLDGPIPVWPWLKAATEYRAAFARFFPGIVRRAA